MAKIRGARSVALPLVILVAMACGGGQDALSLGDTVRTASGNALTVHSFEAPAAPSSQLSGPAPGNVFAAIDVEGCVRDDLAGTALLSAEQFVLQLRDDTLTPPGFGIGPEPELGDTTLGPGECVRGFVTFEIPEGAEPLFVVFQSSGADSEPFIATWTIP